MFSQTDFPVYANKLRLIVLSLMNMDPLTQFRELCPKHQRIFNERMNAYINSLPADFKDKINADYHRVCVEEIFDNLQKKAGNMKIPQINDIEQPKENVDENTNVNPTNSENTP